MSLIFLNVPEARAFFLEHGFVYTLREPRSTGPVRVRARMAPYPRYEDLGLGDVQLVSSEVNDRVLDRYFPESGFKNVWSWRAAVKKTIPSKFLYLLTRTRAT